MTIIRERIGPRNSTVNGDPGRLYDWAGACWDGSAVHVDHCMTRDCTHVHENKAPLPFKDGKPESCQYLHVPWHWVSDSTIYRVYPRDKWCVGEKWYGKTVVRQTVEKDDDGWYWVVELTP